MDCPKCGQWNPDDKRVCWRCDAELPRPVEKPTRKPVVFLGLPLWSWAMMALLLILLFAAQCLGPTLLNRGS
jgi:hypothetical protein